MIEKQALSPSCLIYSESSSLLQLPICKVQHNGRLLSTEEQHEHSSVVPQRCGAPV
jgi:hypothetical protein